MSIPTYKIVSRGGLHYVFGYVGKRGGRAQYMQLSEGLATREEADAARGRYAGSTASAKAELRGWSGGFNVND